MKSPNPRTITAGILTRNANAAQTAPATAAVVAPVSRYTTQASTATTEKKTIGVSEMKKRPKNTALGEIAMRKAAARPTATLNRWDPSANTAQIVATEKTMLTSLPTIACSPKTRYVSATIQCINGNSIPT